MLTQAIAYPDTSRNGPKIGAAGVLTGVLTPLLPPLIDRISGTPGDFRIALVAVPFAISSWFGACPQTRGGRRWRRPSSP
jgi:hypothetical protein